MRRLVVLVILVIGVPAYATEPNPSPRQREIIEQLLQAMNVDRMSGSLINSMFVQIEKQFLDEAVAKGNDPDDIEEAKELFAAVREHSAKVNFGQLLHEAQIRIYAKYFTENELADLAAFYQSPTGKKTIEVMPQLVADGMKAGVDNLTPKMQEVMAEAMEEQERKHPWRRTMADMRVLGAAIEAYQVDRQDETYPEATDVANLKKALKGTTTSQKFPEKDIWGHSYEYIVSADRHHYRIVSAGADGIFDWNTRKIELPSGGSTSPVRYSDRLEDDIIYADGAFVQLPVQAKPKTKSRN